MKFLVDMPLPPAFALWLRGPGHDAVHALDLALDRAPDTEIIARAVTDKRTIITAGLDYPGYWPSAARPNQARCWSGVRIGQRPR